MISCNQSNQDDDLFCASSVTYEPFESYEEPRSGFTCDELENRRTSQSWDGCLYSSQGETFDSSLGSTTDDSTSENEVIENALVSGIKEGTNIATSAGYKLTIEDGYLVHSLINGKKTRYLSYSYPKSVTSWNNQFLVFGNSKISLLDHKGEETWTHDFEGRVKVFLNEETEELTVFETKSKTEDEDECRRIQYVDNSRWGQLNKIHKINLKDFEISTREEIIYGRWTPHVDKKASYLLGKSWPTSQIFKLADKTLYKRLSGRIFNKTAIREYGDELHMIEEVPGERGAKYVVLDNNLNLLKELEVVAPGEFVRAAHFTDDLVYFATFLETDPLFLVDPKNPEYLSELSYPGRPLHLEEVGDYILSLNRSGWNGGSKLNLINKTDQRDIFIQDVLTLDAYFWRFSYLDFIPYENFIFIKDYYKKGFLVKIHEGELLLVSELENTDIGYFLNNHFHYLQDDEWKSIRVKGKINLD